MNKTILQIPIDKTLRDAAAKRAITMGFSSLQDLARLLFTRVASGSLHVSIDTDEEELSPRAAARYKKMIHDIESGKLKTKQFDNTDDLMTYLRS